MKNERHSRTKLIEELESVRRKVKKLESQLKKHKLTEQDNTGHKRVDKGLRQSEELFRLIAENATDLIAVLDREGRRIYNSPSYKSILGDPESLRGTDSFLEIHPDDREKIKRVFLETVRTGIGQRAEYRFMLKDGSVRYIESLGSVVHNENGYTNRVVVVSRDVTERKHAEIALQEAAKEREILIHELQFALDNVKTLQGLIPICANCKKIRDDKGFWNQVEGYISKRTNATFSHGLCPDCSRKLYGGLFEKATEDLKKKNK